MAWNSSSSIFKDGKLKPGTYKLQNIVSKTYVDTKDHVRELCGRPLTALEDGRGQWEIQQLGPGYTIRKAGTSASVQPDQYCTMLDGIGNGYAVSVSDLPVAWRIEVVKVATYRGFEYVRILWGSTNKVWDLAKWGSDCDWTKVQLMDDSRPEPCRTWKLVPVRVENFARQSPPSFMPTTDSSVPPYEEKIGNHRCTCSRLTELGDDGFGTTVTEVATVTTRRRYRLED